MATPKCTLCNSEMEQVDKKIIVDTEYKIWRCDKCKRSVAKSS